ncbi:MAG: hypothetical protein ACI4D4_08065 [Lachnospira sp.]
MEDLGISLDRALPGSIETMMQAGLVLALSAFIVMIIVIMRRWNGRFINVMAGILAYSIFVYIFTVMCLSILALLPGINEAITYNAGTYTFLYCMFSALGITMARAFLGRIAIGRYERKGDVYLSGIGLALGDGLVLYGLSTIANMSYVSGINSVGLSSMLEGMTQDQISAISTSINMLYDAPEYLWLLMGIASTLDILLAVALSSVVFAAMKGKLGTLWICYSAIIQFFSYISFQSFDYTSQTSIIVCFVIKVVIDIVAPLLIYKLVLKEFEYVND